MSASHVLIPNEKDFGYAGGGICGPQLRVWGSFARIDERLTVFLRGSEKKTLKRAHKRTVGGSSGSLWRRRSGRRAKKSTHETQRQNWNAPHIVNEFGRGASQDGLVGKRQDLLQENLQRPQLEVARMAELLAGDLYLGFALSSSWSSAELISLSLSTAPVFGFAFLAVHAVCPSIFIYVVMSSMIAVANSLTFLFCAWVVREIST